MSNAVRTLISLPVPQARHPARPRPKAGMTGGPSTEPCMRSRSGSTPSTVEMCRRENQCGGRAGARLAQYVPSWSTLLFDVANRHDVLYDQLEIYRRGVTNAPRPACCPPPFDVDKHWMTEAPRAYVIPVGVGQRGTPEAHRPVRW